jgi:hypothetical protein
MIFRHRVPAGVPSRSWRLAGRHFRFAAPCSAILGDRWFFPAAVPPSVRGGGFKGMCGQEFRYRQRANGLPRCRYIGGVPKRGTRQKPTSLHEDAAVSTSLRYVRPSDERRMGTWSARLALDE